MTNINLHIQEIINGMEYGVSFGGDENILKLDSDDDFMTENMLKTSESYSKMVN